ncbi:YCF48-related protein [Flaviaesturariibacter amylovorans]|uniref:Photosynthesis system II assembly factor Ycf48/Hcf136-like domain-containing protein n=1 Tax=Flaviaesturariibacter amylovorans TaxID=1084520 RepID=A0ABP8H7K9_9BACT
MKTLLHTLALTLASFAAGAQGWTLVTPVKSQSAIEDVFMTSPSTGFAFDDLDDRMLRTRDGGLTWHRQGLVFGTTPTSLWMFNDNVGIMGTATGTFYKTTDGFVTRSTVNSSTGATKALFFVNEQTGYAIAGDVNIKKTTDGGNTWTLINTGNSNFLFGLYFIDANTGFASGASGTILKTTDADATWTPLTTNYSFLFNDVLFTSPTVGMAVGAQGYLSRTTDGGATWTAVAMPTTQHLFTLYSYNNTLFALGANGALLRSTNNGASWTATTLGTYTLHSIHINSFGQGFIGGDAGIYKTTDGGMTWTPSQLGSPHSNLNKVSFANENIGLAVGTQSTGGMVNALVRTTDGGKTWTGRNIGTSVLGVHLRADGNGLFGGSSGYYEYTSNYGQNFNFGGNRPNVAVRTVWAQNATTWIMGGGFFNGGLYRTTNSGATWTYTAGGSMLDIYFPTALVGYAGGEGGELKKTTDGGASWTTINSGVTGDINAVYFLNEQVGFVGTPGSLRKTTDGGATWSGFGPSYVMALHFYTADSGYAVTVSGHLLKTIDGGANWSTHAPGIIADMLVRDAAFLNGRVVAVGQLGDVYVSNLSCAGAVGTPRVIQSGATLYSSFATGNQWYNGSGAIAGATGASYTASVPGTYYVVHTSADGCASPVSNSITIVATSIPSVREGRALVIYPNPTAARIRIEVPSALRREPLLLRNAAGQLALVRKGAHPPVLTLDLGHLPAGTYYLQLGKTASPVVLGK